MKSKEKVTLYIGTFFEYFDFMLYIHMATYLNLIFFSFSNSNSAETLIVFSFCSSYILRPLGSIIFGYIGDKIGRKSVIITTMFLMSISCITIITIPTYAEIGIYASIIIVTCRMIQGMTAMGETLGVQLFLTEHLLPPKVYSAVAAVPLFVSIGSTAALFISYAVTSLEFNWRLAFLFGAVTGIIGLILNKNLVENNISKNTTNSQTDVKQSSRLYKNYGMFFLINCMWPTCFYYIYIYSSIVLKNVFNLSNEQIIVNNIYISFSQILSDLINFILSHFLYPLVILKIKIFIFLFFVIFFSFCFTFKTHQDVFYMQAILIFFAVDGVSASSIFYKNFPQSMRFRMVGTVYALSRTMLYVIMPIGVFYIENNALFKNAIYFFAPLSIGFYIALKYFEREDKSPEKRWFC